MRAAEIRAAVFEDGFAVLPGHLPAKELAAGVAEVPVEFPTAAEFHDDVDPARNERFRDEFGGIVNFPFSSVELCLLAVHPSLIDLAALLLGSPRIRVYSSEAWAKYTGAARYEQTLHRDYLNHTLLVPEPRPSPSQLEMFVYLHDTPAELGPPAFVPRRFTRSLPALPNWYPRAAGAADPDHPAWVDRAGRPELYDHEVLASGPAGTVVVYGIETFHRGTALSRPRGARYTLHTSFRAEHADWITRRAWTDSANTEKWHRFVTRASVRQLELFGFPPPGDPYWCDETLEGLRVRYPGLDVSRWA